jgi:LCCL domain
MARSPVVGVAVSLIVVACTGPSMVIETAPLPPPDLEPTTTEASSNPFAGFASEGSSLDEEWIRSAEAIVGPTGTQQVFQCPSEGTEYPIWGSGTYTDDSSVCTAAVHVGLIGFDNGGEVKVELRPGEGSYASISANGVTSRSWGPWPRSFVFVN